MRGPAFRLLAESARVDEDQPGETEVLHDPGGKPDISLVEGFDEDDVNLGHKKSYWTASTVAFRTEAPWS